LRFIVGRFIATNSNPVIPTIGDRPAIAGDLTEWRDLESDVSGRNRFFLAPAHHLRYDAESEVSYLRIAVRRSLFDKARSLTNQIAGPRNPFPFPKRERNRAL
jgi:hypothetical protein